MLRKTVALTTAEAAYYSASLGEADVIFPRQLPRDMELELKSPTPVYEDSRACIERTNAIGGRGHR